MRLDALARPQRAISKFCQALANFSLLLMSLLHSGFLRKRSNCLRKRAGYLHCFVLTSGPKSWPYGCNASKTAALSHCSHDSTGTRTIHVQAESLAIQPKFRNFWMSNSVFAGANACADKLSWLPCWGFEAGISVLGWGALKSLIDVCTAPIPKAPRHLAGCLVCSQWV